MQLEKAMSGHNPNDHVSFDVDKAIASIGFLADATKESMYSILKMLYLADKRHLQRFGRFIFGDRYCAMQQGPVPSYAYAVFQHLRRDIPNADFERADEFFAYNPDHTLVLKRAPELDELSRGELECLEAVVAAYFNMGKWAVRDMSHDAAWVDAWSARGIFKKKAVRMSIEDIAKQFENADDVIEHLRDPNPGEAPTHVTRPDKVDAA